LKKSDRKLGMGQDITRRDFIHDASIMSLGLGLLPGSVAAGDPGSASEYYPPTRTGTFLPGPMPTHTWPSMRPIGRLRNWFNSSTSVMPV
jgi:hypothetical protein